MDIRLENVLDYEQPTKYIVKSENYSDDFALPVLTAGKSFVLGYTDETEGVCKASENPVIIFDDFTADCKYIDFDFKVKSSAMKILHKVNADDNLKYYFYAMQAIDYTPFSHKRVWISEYSKFKIKNRSVAEQNIVVKDLDTIVSAIDNANQRLNALDELVKSRFIEMFGDPVDNPKGWDKRPLLDMGTCKNGLNYRSGETGVSVHCLGVGDFKDLSIIEDVSTLSTIELAKLPSEERMLKDGDIVFVRSNGNKALVGRCLAVYPHTTKAVHSGFCIRYRRNCDDLDTTYLLSVLKSDSMRVKMAGHGANIQNLNQKILASLDIPIPPLSLQNEFAEFVKLTDKSKFIVQKQIEDLQELLDSKMDEYFG